MILPGALPGFVNGLKQGWAFAWRSLMAAELVAPVAGTRSIGFRLDNARSVLDAPGLYGTMIIILVLGIAVDMLVFRGSRASCATGGGWRTRPPERKVVRLRPSIGAVGARRVVRPHLQQIAGGEIAAPRTAQRGLSA